MAEVESSVRGDKCGVEAAECAGLSAAERARCERNRLRARALRDARLADRAAPAPAPRPVPARGPVDSGGGFLLEPEERCSGAAATAGGGGGGPPAPLQPPDQPPCLECGRPIATSYLLDTFQYNVCDACRDEDGAHSLLTRTEAKTEFLLKDCDLDARSPPLPHVRRPNPHRGARHDMRLYLRAHVEARALLVWGAPPALEAERAARAERRAQAHGRTERRRLRALRMQVRSSLYAAPRAAAAAHAHRWAPETHDPAADTYSRVCRDCGHAETYEKM